MKPTEKKERFIILRSEGRSYSTIAAELGISKSTCTKWARELEDRIRKARDDRMDEVYYLYRIGREAYIRKLGDVLSRIDQEIARRDFSEIPADKLLKLKLEYEGRLQGLRTDPADSNEAFDEYTHSEVLKAAGELYERIKAGSITPQQARGELTILEGLNRAIDQW